MRIPRLFLIVGLAILTTAATGRAQNTIVQNFISVSQKLAGHVSIGEDKFPADHVTVELCSHDWQTVLASTKTDETGYFSLKPGSTRLFYIRFSNPQLQSYELRVRISPPGPKELTIRMLNGV